MKILAKKPKEAPIVALKIAPPNPTIAIEFPMFALLIHLRMTLRVLFSKLYASNLSSLSEF